jgi:hypothetical protein
LPYRTSAVENGPIAFARADSPIVSMRREAPLRSLPGGSVHRAAFPFPRPSACPAFRNVRLLGSCRRPCENPDSRSEKMMQCSNVMVWKRLAARGGEKIRNEPR